MHSKMNKSCVSGLYTFFDDVGPNPISGVRTIGVKLKPSRRRFQLVEDGSLHWIGTTRPWIGTTRPCTIDLIDFIMITLRAMQHHHIRAMHLSSF